MSVFRSTTPSLVMIFVLMFFVLMAPPPVYPCQRSDPGSDRTGEQQAAAPKAVPASTPSQGAAAPAAATPESLPPPDETSSIDSALQSQIEDAFRKDPAFSQGSLKVTVLPDGIELSGDVASGRDRQNAARLAQSYARGKKVLNHIVVKGHSSLPASNAPQNSPASVASPAGGGGTGKSSPPGP